MSNLAKVEQVCSRHKKERKIQELRKEFICTTKKSNILFGQFLQSAVLNLLKINKKKSVGGGGAEGLKHI